MYIRTIEDMHICQIGLLSDFDRLCRDNGIKYFVFEGTLLGAVRHRDFIPWDDDMDVVLFREDYNRLLALPESEYPGHMKMYYPTANGTFLDFIPRIVDVRHEADPYPLTKHPFIDIFVLDGSYGGKKQKLRVTAQRLVYAMAMGHRGSRSILEHTIGHESAALRRMTRPLQCLGRLVSLKKKAGWYASLSERCTGTEMLYVSNMNPFLMHREYDASWFSGAVPLEIRGLTVPAPEGYDNILRISYGDYTKLPPAESRKPVHFKYSDDPGQE